MTDPQTERAREVLANVISCGIGEDTVIGPNHAIEAMLAFAQERATGGEDKGVSLFLDAILEQSPDGETVSVKYHPNGDWTVYDRVEVPVKVATPSPAPAALVEREGSLAEAIANPALAISRLNRDELGRMVRKAWVRWAEKQPAPKPSWLLPYDDLAEPDKEVDRQIGVDLARIGATAWVASQRFNLAARGSDVPRTGGGEVIADAGRECQSVWRCAIGDAVSAIDVLKRQWESSRRKHDREAAATLSGVADLIWAARDPAPHDYKAAAALGKKLIELVHDALAEANVTRARDAGEGR